MGTQEIIAGIVVLSAALYSFRLFFKQFTSEEGSCSSCSCEQPVEKFKKASLNTPVFRKATE